MKPHAISTVLAVGLLAATAWGEVTEISAKSPEIQQMRTITECVTTERDTRECDKETLKQLTDAFAEVLSEADPDALTAEQWKIVDEWSWGVLKTNSLRSLEERKAMCKLAAGFMKRLDTWSEGIENVLLGPCYADENADGVEELIATKIEVVERNLHVKERTGEVTWENRFGLGWHICRKQPTECDRGARMMAEAVLTREAIQVLRRDAKRRHDLKNMIYDGAVHTARNGPVTEEVILKAAFYWVDQLEEGDESLRDSWNKHNSDKGPKISFDEVRSGAWVERGREALGLAQASERRQANAGTTPVTRPNLGPATDDPTGAETEGSASGEVQPITHPPEPRSPAPAEENEPAGMPERTSTSTILKVVAVVFAVFVLFALYARRRAGRSTDN